MVTSGLLFFGIMFIFTGLRDIMGFKGGYKVTFSYWSESWSWDSLVSLPTSSNRTPVFYFIAGWSSSFCWNNPWQRAQWMTEQLSVLEVVINFLVLSYIPESCSYLDVPSWSCLFLPQGGRVNIMCPLYTHTLLEFRLCIILLDLSTSTEVIIRATRRQKVVVLDRL